MTKKRKNILVTDRERWNTNWFERLTEGKYAPYFLTQDVPSSGARYRVEGFKSGRCHHFLSTNEYLFFFHLDFEPLVGEIFEQYALLPISLTSEIANRLSLEHPKYKNSGILSTVTTDFLVRMQDNTRIAYSIKQEGALEDDRTNEKQYIEKAYWELIGVEWRLVQSNEIKTTKSKNLEALHFYKNLTELQNNIQPSWLDRFFEVIEQHQSYTLRDAIKESANNYGIEYRFAVDLFKNAAWKRLISFDFDTPFHFDRLLSDFRIVRND